MIDDSLKVKLGDWELDNPIIPASGTFGYGFEFDDFYEINVLGSFCIKGTTLELQYGNPLPRIAEVPNGMINSIGLQNPGVDHIIKYELPELAKKFDKKVIANIAATTIEDYVKIIEKLNDQNIIGIYEVNISCPNVKKGALIFDKDPVALTQLIVAIKKVSKKPIYIKLSPQVNNIVDMAVACEKAGADGIVLVNTIPGMRIDLKTAKPILGNVIGGVSGPILKPIALRAIYLCYKAVKIPIIGCGGVRNEDDVIEMMYAGATAVEIGSENLVNPTVCWDIIKNLPIFMKKYKINKLRDIIGKAHE